MSESRNNGESRGYPRYQRDYSPSYHVYSGNNCDDRNKQSRIQSSKQKPEYNNLDDIDTLIERLEREIPREKATSSKVNDAYDARRKKLAELKELQQQARREQERQRMIAEEEKSLPRIQQGNDELDEAIAQIKQMVKKTTQSFELRGDRYLGNGEGHNGESRW